MPPKTSNWCKKYICCFTKKLSEIGGFLLGTSALIALCKTDVDELLQKVLEIRSGVAQLKEGNYRLEDLAQQHRDGIKELKDIVKALNEQLINNEAHKVLENTQKLAPENRIKILKNISPPETSALKDGQIYLPRDALEEAKKIFEKNDPILQQEYLRQNLKIWNQKS